MDPIKLVTKALFFVAMVCAIAMFLNTLYFMITKQCDTIAGAMWCVLAIAAAALFYKALTDE